MVHKNIKILTKRTLLEHLVHFLGQVYYYSTSSIINTLIVMLAMAMLKSNFSLSQLQAQTCWV